MRNISRFVVLTLLTSILNACGNNSTKDLPWSSVNLEGAHLRLVSPKEKEESLNLSFGKGGVVLSSSCNSQDGCVGAPAAWKIENNRLKMGDAPTEGNALVGVTANKLTLREPSDKLVVYEIVSEH
jgi:hypothetical protein